MPTTPDVSPPCACFRSTTSRRRLEEGMPVWPEIRRCRSRRRRAPTPSTATPPRPWRSPSTRARTSMRRFTSNRAPRRSTRSRPTPCCGRSRSTTSRTLGARPGELIGETSRRPSRPPGSLLEAGDTAVLSSRRDRRRRCQGNWGGRNEPGLTEQACAYLASAGVAAVASTRPAATSPSRRRRRRGTATRSIPAERHPIVGACAVAPCPRRGCSWRCR